METTHFVEITGLKANPNPNANGLSMLLSGELPTITDNLITAWIPLAWLHDNKAILDKFNTEEFKIAESTYTVGSYAYITVEKFKAGEPVLDRDKKPVKGKDGKDLKYSASGLKVVGIRPGSARKFSKLQDSAFRVAEQKALLHEKAEILIDMQNRDIDIPSGVGL